MVAKHRAQVIVVDYVPSAFYCPAMFEFGVPVILITLNREAEFYNDQLKHGLMVNGRPGTRVAGHRIRRVERSLYRKSAAVVAIGKYDVPKPFLFKRSRYFVVPPILDPKPQAQSWTFSNTRSLFFVGRIGHYPNKEAIDWLATKLSPILAKLDSEITIKIVGASASEVPLDWRHDNIRFLGVSNRFDVDMLFRTEDLFIAPILNNYGAKLKVAEAMAYGTPFLASEGALSGVLE
ncbi:MAG: glycosyltransferase, partial [Candidatus Sulfotelmatobacter sp.]